MWISTDSYYLHHKVYKFIYTKPFKIHLITHTFFQVQKLSLASLLLLLANAVAEVDSILSVRGGRKYHKQCGQSLSKLKSGISTFFSLDF